MPIDQTLAMSTSATSSKSVSQPCNCLGARHRVITNCLECGYLVCEQDASPDTILLPSLQTKVSTTTPSSSAQSSNYSSLFCPYCHVPCVLPYNAAEVRTLYGTASPETTRYVRAYEMKDRLLQFDQEHAQRTRVYDAQGDYYNAGGNMAWLNEQERKRLEAIEARRQAMRQRSRVARKVNIVFNIAGQRVVDVDPFTDIDEEAEDEEDEEVARSYGTQRIEADEVRQLVVCKAVLDERDVGSGDALMGAAAGNATGSWATGTLKQTFDKAAEIDKGETDESSDLVDQREVEAAASADALPEDPDTPVLGLENTTMQLQGTKAAETYRYMRLNLQRLLAGETTSLEQGVSKTEKRAAKKSPHQSAPSVTIGSNAAESPAADTPRSEKEKRPSHAHSRNSAPGSGSSSRNQSHGGRGGDKSSNRHQPRTADSGSATNK